MTKERSTALYSSPFSKGYWKDACQELTSMRMLVVTALLIALRIVLKPLAIPLGPNLAIQTAMLATALGAMVYGPVVAIPAAVISDTVGFLIYPTGDYFLPFVLTEIASTLFYALFLYRAKVTPMRVMLSRFCICFFVNVVLQQFIFAWYYVYIGNPEEAKESILGIMTLSRILKNIAIFPLETVVLTLFLKFLMPVTQRAKLTYCSNADMKFTKKQIAALVLLVLVGIGTATGYLAYRYSNTSRTADYSKSERRANNKAMTQLVLEETRQWDDETLVCIIDSAYRGLFQKETAYTVSVYTLDQEAFAAGQADNSKYSMETLFGYSKSGPKKDKYGSLEKVATAKFTMNEDTRTYQQFTIQEVE